MAETYQNNSTEDVDELAVKFGEMIDDAERIWEERLWKKIRINRRYASGKIGNDELANSGDERLVRANLVYSTMRGLMPHIYAKNPEISVTPEESVGEDRYQWVRPYAKTLELVTNRQLRDGGLKSVGKRQVLGGLTAAIGWKKISYQRNYERDPLIQSRIEDAQDNIARIRAMQEDLEEGECANEEATLQELEHLVSALEQEVEVVKGEGLVVDFVQGTNMIPDPTIEDFSQYAKGRFLVQKIWMNPEEAKEKLKYGTEGARLFTPGDDKRGIEPQEAAAGKDPKDGLILVYEIWHKQTQTVYTLCKGMKSWARDPIQPKRLGQRWYPFFGLAFFPLDGEPVPLSIIDLLRELQDEYNSTRTQLAEHREMSVPHYIADKMTDTDDIVRKRDAKLGEIVIVDANGRPLNQVFMAAEPPPFNPAIYDTTPIRTDIEQVSGLQDAERGSVVRTKTATEAEFLQQGMASKTETMKDELEDLYTEAGMYAAEILAQELSIWQAMRIAGPGAVWPDLPKEEIFDLVEIGIRAGSSGKPNKRLEQETWIKVKPEIENTITRIMEMQGMGMDPSPMIALLKETLRRFDERLDVEQFLPVQSQQTMIPGMPGVQGMPAGQAGGPGNVLPFPPQEVMPNATS